MSSRNYDDYSSRSTSTSSRGLVQLSTPSKGSKYDDRYYKESKYSEPRHASSTLAVPKSSRSSSSSSKATAGSVHSSSKSQLNPKIHQNSNYADDFGRRGPDLDDRYYKNSSYSSSGTKGKYSDRKDYDTRYYRESR
ncbi:hypothetical protein MMC28_002679 [Mycoblastus sanguinarius]|nr:hypothetical protein [Mycoblastus sanguinarius]